MKEEYIKILMKAKSKLALVKKKLSNVQRKSIKTFDRTVQQMHVEAFTDIDCTECANCCVTLGPKFNETDILKISSHVGMKRNEFIAKYLKVDEDGDTIFTSMPCPFLGSDRLCEVYEVRPKACRDYPHTDEKNMQPKLPLLVQNTCYCPAASIIADRIIEKFEK